MTENQKEKSFFHFLLRRLLVPLVALVTASLLVYYFGFSVSKSSEKPDSFDKLLLQHPEQSSDRGPTTLEQEKNLTELSSLDQDAAAQQQAVIDSADSTVESLDQASLSGQAQGDLLLRSRAAPTLSVAEQVTDSTIDPIALPLPATLATDSADQFNFYLLLSDFIVRVRTGLPFEGTLIQLNRKTRDPKLKNQLNLLAPYALEGLGSWCVLMNDLKKTLDRGVHSKAKKTDPWVIKFVKSFLHVRIKSSYAPQLQDALDHRSWPEAYLLTEKLIEEGFPLKRWLTRLKKFVKGHVLLNAFLLAQQGGAAPMNFSSEGR